MIGDDTLRQARRLLDRLQQAGLTLATAESCTGGLIVATLTHHAGSSASVLGGFVTYSNAMKHDLLGVDPALIDREGAVSAGVAAAMAEGALSRSGSDLAIAVTGIAGPSGATPDKPVGLVWFGIAGRDRPTTTTRMIFPGDRASVREATVDHALELVGRAIQPA